MREYKLKLAPIAKAEIKDARDWYRKIDPELPKRLIKEITRSLNAISLNPAAYAIRYRLVRRYNLRAFPYFLHYIIYEEDLLIIVIGFYHQAQHPDSWNKI